MKLQEKQRQEKNKATLVLGLLILGYATFIALLGLVDSTANMSIVIPRAIVSVLIFAAFIVSYFKFKGQRTFEILCMVCMFTSYGVTILTQRNIYMYALVYPIMLTVMLYMDKHRARVAMIVAIALNLVGGIKNYITYPETSGQSFSRCF